MINKTNNNIYSDKSGEDNKTVNKKFLSFDRDFMIGFMEDPEIFDESTTASNDIPPIDLGEKKTNSDSKITKINFGIVTSESLSDIPQNTNFIQDVGKEYDAARGYGWVTQNTLGSNKPAPIDITPNARNRNSIEETDLDSLIHLQYSESFNNPNGVITNAGWEYNLNNGKYKVTVSVGDPDFTDSNHVINVENENLIAGFTPTEDKRFETKSTTVEVTDGKLSIDAVGGENTKINYVEISPADESLIPETPETPIDTTPIAIPTSFGIPTEGGGIVAKVEPIAGGINVNFGTPTVNSSPEFIQDIGIEYSDERGYGWVTQESARSDNPAPISIVPNGRDRNTLFNDGEGGLFSEPVKDSLIHMQYPTGAINSDISVTTPAAWEYELENGQYEVTVGVGDSSFFNSNHVINIEGESVIDGFTPIGSEVNGYLPLGAQAFTSETAIVNVNDGRLTVDAIGGENTKINYISIVPIDSKI